MGVEYLDAEVTGANMGYQDSMTSGGNGKHLEIDNVVTSMYKFKNAGEVLNIKGHTL